MKGFRINGSFSDIRSEQVFSIEIAAEDIDAAKEKIISTLGSKHKLKRRDITIRDIVELKADEITNPVVQHQVGVI